MAAQVSISIVGRTYEIACDEGQEQAVMALARDVDKRATELMRSVGQVGDARLLVMLALLMADEIGDMRRLLGQSDHPGDVRLAQGIEQMARRIEAMADKLGTPPQDNS